MEVNSQKQVDTQKVGERGGGGRGLPFFNVLFKPIIVYNEGMTAVKSVYNKIEKQPAVVAEWS